MKIVFLYPFINDSIGSPVKWLPLSSPSLIGHVRKDFPNIDFDQIDIEEEIKDLILPLKKEFYALFKRKGICSILKKGASKYCSFFDSLISSLVLEQYDHYFFTVFNRNKIGIYAHILLAAYLKKRYPSKNIIFGGMYGIEDNLLKQSFEEFDFIDSSVIGPGESPLKSILHSLLNNNGLNRIYQGYGDKNSTTRLEELRQNPFFDSFKSINHFIYKQDTLSSLYKTSLLPEGTIYEPVMFLPYRFSSGCFWGKCSYCGGSAKNKGVVHKNINEIINDLMFFKHKFHTNYFVFYNSNFNFDLDFAKKLLREIISNNLNILWTDSFNLVVLDEELIALLQKAGCFRADIGVTTVDPQIQKIHHNVLQDNKYLDNLKLFSQYGIWTHINLIANLPHQYSVEKDKEILDQYIRYIDGISLNSFRKYKYADITCNYSKYNVKNINEKIKPLNTSMTFLENDFCGSINRRKKMYIHNFKELYAFLKQHPDSIGIINQIHLYLLGLLYNSLGFSKKDKIRQIIKTCHNNL